ncbi:MAG: hypothetical protein O2800_06945 [Planctomycetota bacterium]|nr:hypothetical protein [Planctomycetota bacterium]
MLPKPLAHIRDILEVLNTPIRFTQDAIRFPFSENRYRKWLQAELLSGRPVCAVYSAPKTASSAVLKVLEATKRYVVPRVHIMGSEHLFPGVGHSMVGRDGLLKHKAAEQRACRSMLFETDLPIRVVSMVREPVGFNVSNFTYFGRAYWMRTCWRAAPYARPEELWSRFQRVFPHSSASVWWEKEHSAFTGIVIRPGEFDADRGWGRFQSGRVDALVLRCDIPDDQKRTAIEEWLGHPVPPVERENQNDVYVPPIVLDRVRDQVRQHPEYVDRCLSLPYMNIFWTKAQQDAIALRWRGN